MPMKAMVYREYGPPHEVLSLEEIPRPDPEEDEVVVRVHSASVNPLDSHIMTTIVGRLMCGLRRPRNPIPGVDVSGVVETVGSRVTEFTPGDAVFGSSEGAFAEYSCAKEAKLAVKPAGLSHEQVAALPVAGLTALQGLRDAGRLKAKQRVAITGASGGVGTFAIQIAKLYGAYVTAVCSTRNLELVRGLGADHVIDYTQQDFTRPDQPYDLIFDLAGNRSLSDLRRALVPKGIYVGVGMLGRGISIPAILGGLLGTLALKPFISQKLVTFMAKVNTDDLATLAEMAATGKITPVIDRRYNLTETADAIQYVREKKARGKVVINTQ